jgi:archaellum component FlaC
LDELIEALRSDIERLRKELERVTVDAAHLDSGEVLRISGELDRLIMKFYHLTGPTGSKST